MYGVMSQIDVPYFNCLQCQRCCEGNRNIKYELKWKLFTLCVLPVRARAHIAAGAGVMYHA